MMNGVYNEEKKRKYPTGIGGGVVKYRAESNLHLRCRENERYARRSANWVFANVNKNTGSAGKMARE